MITYDIYIVDDEDTVRNGIATALESDYRVKAFATAESALEAMEQGVPDLMLLDIGLPGLDGIEALGRIKQTYPDLLVIMITAYEDIRTVISAMKLGAYDYVVKPIHMDSLELTIANALENVRLRKEVQALQEKYLKENVPFFIGESHAIQDVMTFVGQVAKSPDTPVLIIGETGTGKELIASAIHYRSPNFKGPLIVVNCAAIPKDLIESELFGYERGAFSGASPSGKKGLIEEAEGGTLFLDEVGDLSHEAQSKLLRFLEEGEFYKLGGTRKIRVTTRVLSATNKNLDEMIEKGLFRKDLYFRLGVIRVEVPSLNERKEDIIPLAKYFLLEFSKKFGKSFTGIAPEAEKALLNHRWVGHVRELRNLIERGVLIGTGPLIRVDDLGLSPVDQARSQEAAQIGRFLPPLGSETMDLMAALESLERYYLEGALRIAGGNESRAAKLLSMNHHTFRYRRRKLGIK